MQIVGSEDKMRLSFLRAREVAIYTHHGQKAVFALHSGLLILAAAQVSAVLCDGMRKNRLGCKCFITKLQYLQRDARIFTAFCNYFSIVAIL